MSFFPSTDKRPVYFDSFGNPLINGRLSYFDLNNPTVPKTVYSDFNTTIAAANPQILNASGRTDTEIFLGVGDYFVMAERWNPSTSSYVADNQWDDSGLPTPSSLLSSGLITVGSIADLELVDPTVYTTVLVLGYYAAGDMFARIFEWNATDTTAGNGGTIIKHGTGSLGSWIYSVGNTDVLDVRIFGCLPISASAFVVNDNIVWANTFAQTQASPKSLFFPSGTYQVSGTYTQNLNVNVIIDDNVFFRNISNFTVYTLAFNSTFDIRTTQPLQAGSPSVLLTFAGTQNACVRASWFGLVGSSSDHYSAFAAMVAGVAPNFTVIIDGNIYLGSSTTAALTILNPLKFILSGMILVNQTAFAVNFNGGFIINETSITDGDYVLGCLTSVSGNYSNWSMNNFDNVLSSWFADGTGSTGQTQVLNGILRGITFTEGTGFIFDHPTNLFDNTVVDPSITNPRNLIFKNAGGVLQKTVAGLGHIFLPRCEFSGGYFIAGYGFTVGNQENHVDWWLPPSANESQQTNAWINAVDSAITGQGTLNMDGQTLTIQATANLISTYTENLIVKNGGIIIDYAVPAVTFVGNGPSIAFRDFVAVANTTGSLVTVASGGILGEFLCTDSAFTGGNGTFLLNVLAGGSVAEADIGRNEITASIIVQTISGLQYLNIHDNLSLIGDLITDNCTIIATNNDITGGQLGMWKGSCFDSFLFNNNRVYQCDLWVMDNGGIVDAVVNGNQFESTDTKWSRIVYYSRTINSRFAGAVATGNSFTGQPTTQFPAIIFTPSINNPITSSEMWSTYLSPIVYNHSINISNNSSSSDNIIVPVTRGLVKNPVVTGMGFSTTTLYFYFYQNPSVFYIAGSQNMGNVRNMSAQPAISPPDAGIYPNPMPNFLGWDTYGTTGGLPPDTATVDENIALIFENLPLAGSYAGTVGVTLNIDLY